MIYNRERFEQKLDYSDFPFFASDVDSLTNIKGKMWLANETKVEGNTIPRGQEISIKEMVNQLGHFQPTFYVVTHHNTKANEYITGDKMLVSTVYFKAPHIPSVQVYDYDEDERPTYNKFCLLLAVACEVQNKLKKGQVLDDIINVLDPIMRKYSFDEISRKTLTEPDVMQSFAEMDYWDDFTPEQKSFMWSCRIFDELDFYAKAYLPWTKLIEQKEYQQ